MRCVNIDWLEVYCLESNDRFPMNADYFRAHGYMVHERDYGTRQYNEMFTIEDEMGHPFLEVRRNPKTDSPLFKGFVPQSTHLRLVNRYCYFPDCVSRLRDFLAQHDYIFKRIYRIDIAYDFHTFDSGDKPEKFARRYIEKRYRKINQAKIATWGDDNWSDFNWESLKWGRESSMVTTKLYNKTKELKDNGYKKSYIYDAWFNSGLVDNPITLEVKDKNGEISKPDIWRIEFSLKSNAGTWIEIENSDSKKNEKIKIDHNLELFDTPEKLWNRFQGLAYHYFRFKIMKYKRGRRGVSSPALSQIVSDTDAEPLRKDLCPDKVLFNFNYNPNFLRLQQVGSDDPRDRTLDPLLRRLEIYYAKYPSPEVYNAIEILKKDIQYQQARDMVPEHTTSQTRALQQAIAIRWGYSPENLQQFAVELERMIKEGEIF